MVGIQDWFNVYAGIRDAVNGLKADLDAVKTAMQSLQHTVDIGMNDVATVTGEGFLSVGKTLGRDLQTPLKNVSDRITDITNRITSIDDYFATIAGIDLPAIRDAQVKLGASVPDAMRALGKAMTALTQEGSPSLLDDFRAVVKSIHGNDAKIAEWLESTKGSSDDTILGALAKKGEQVIEDKLAEAIGVLRPALNILEIPFTAIVNTALKEFTDAFTGNKPANPYAARELVATGITKAYQMGEAAHLLAAAAEMFQPLKQMGFPQLAAALGDLSGFKEISGTLSRSLVMASITRPLRWWGNVEFRPEILTPRDLIELVQKRELDLSDFAYVLYQHGLRKEDTDLLTKAVWREPTIRDLAIAIEDTSVADDWLLERVRKAGYEDSDADQLTKSLVQRSLKGVRGRVISAALANVTDGLLDTESYRTILESLQLRQDEIDLQIRTAELTSRRDTVNTAIATYKRMYVNGPIERSDFTLALTALGVNPDRVELIALDADAQRAPKIAREEDAKIKEAVREIQRELVPRYRRLYELGVIGDDAYQNILVEAGISPQVAAQAVLLDRQKRQIVTSTAQATALERETARLVSDTEEALRLQFRKGLIDEGQLKRSLEDLGYSDERVGVIVNGERARLAPPPGKVIEAPAEAKARVLRDLAIQTALNDFRKGRIEALDLYDELVAQGMTEDEALARVNLEISRLPVPTGSRQPTT